MKIVLAQTRLKTADFNYNFKSIKDKINDDCDLIVFPCADIEDMGGKDLILDEDCRKAQIKFYDDTASLQSKPALLIGDILVRNGEVEVSNDGYFEICGKKVFVSDTYIEDVECDLYVLAKNRYFAMNTYKDFVESIEPDCDFIYVNAVGMADENIYAGGSFAKNSKK